MAGNNYKIRPEAQGPLGEAVRDRIRSFVRDEFIAKAGLADRAAADITNAVINQAHETDVALHGKDRSWRFASRVIGAAESAITCARATALCPGAAAWWQGEGSYCLTLLGQGKASEAEALQAESLAGPSDLDMDFNWPDYKLFRAGSNFDLVVGRELIGGDGEGARVKLRIVERNGELGLERIPGTGWNPTSEIWRQAYDDIHRLLPADQ